MGLAVLTMLMLLGQQSAPTAPADPPPPSELPVSVERIREGLQRPVLKIPPIESMPVFRATVEGEAPFDNPLQGMRRELAEYPTGVGGRLGGIDVLPAVMGIVKSIKSAYRAHAEAEIRKEVQAALDAFCAEHDCSVLEGPPPMEGIVLPRKSRP
jgi:hypothetical protein